MQETIAIVCVHSRELWVAQHTLLGGMCFCCIELYLTAGVLSTCDCCKHGSGLDAGVPAADDTRWHGAQARYCSKLSEYVLSASACLPVRVALVEHDCQDDILGQVGEVDHAGLWGHVCTQVSGACRRGVPWDAVQGAKGKQLQHNTRGTQHTYLSGTPSMSTHRAWHRHVSLWKRSKNPRRYTVIAASSALHLCHALLHTTSAKGVPQPSAKGGHWPLSNKLANQTTVPQHHDIATQPSM